MKLLFVLLLLGQSLLAKTVQYEMQLQLADKNGAPIASTAFGVTLTVVQTGNKITVNFPTINFQVGECAPADPLCMGSANPGYLITAANVLPPDWRPNTLIPVSVLAGAGDGLAQT